MSRIKRIVQTLWRHNSNTLWRYAAMVSIHRPNYVLRNSLLCPWKRNSLSVGNKTGRGVEKNSAPRRELNPHSPVAHFLNSLQFSTGWNFGNSSERGPRTAHLEPEVYCHMCYLFPTEARIPFILARIELDLFNTVVNTCFFDAQMPVTLE